MKVRVLDLVRKRRLITALLLSTLLFLMVFPDALVFGGTWKNYVVSAVIEIICLDAGIIIGYIIGTK